LGGVLRIRRIVDSLHNAAKKLSQQQKSQPAPGGVMTWQEIVFVAAIWGMLVVGNASRRDGWRFGLFELFFVVALAAVALTVICIRPTAK
jgi:hypothetical protein